MRNKAGSRFLSPQNSIASQNAEEKPRSAARQSPTKILPPSQKLRLPGSAPTLGTNNPSLLSLPEKSAPHRFPAGNALQRNSRSRVPPPRQRMRPPTEWYRRI